MATIDEFIAKMRKLELVTMRSSPAVAAAMGRAFHDRVVAKLRHFQHPMYVRTQAPAGGPPAMMSGELAYSITMEVRGGAGGSARAYVGPHTIYAGVQEFGKEISARNVKFMRWYMDEQWWYKKHVTIPERPYMRPTRDEMIADGSLHRVAVATFLAAERYAL